MCYPVFLETVSVVWAQNWFSNESNYRARITCINLCSSYLQSFDNFSSDHCFLLAITCTREHSITKHTHTSLTSLKIKIIIYQQTDAPQKDLRPRHKSIQRGESNSAVTNFWTLYWKLSWKEVKMDHTKIFIVDLDSPCWKLSASCRGLS